MGAFAVRRGGMKRLALTLSLAFMVGCGGAPARPDPGDEAAARARYDTVALAWLDGDALRWRQGLVELVRDYPETRYGRHADRVLRQGSAVAPWLMVPILMWQQGVETVPLGGALTEAPPLKAQTAGQEGEAAETH